MMWWRPFVPVLIHLCVVTGMLNRVPCREHRATCSWQASRVAHSHGQGLADGVKVGGAEGHHWGKGESKATRKVSDVKKSPQAWTTHEHASTMWATLEWLQIAQPKTAVLENVTGIRAVERGADRSPLDVILHEVTTFGYAAMSVDINLASWHEMERGRVDNQESHGTKHLSPLPGWPSIIVQCLRVRVVRVYVLLIHNDHGGRAAIDEAATMFEEAMKVMSSRPQVSKEDLLLREDDPRVQEQLDQIKAGWTRWTRVIGLIGVSFETQAQGVCRQLEHRGSLHKMHPTWNVIAIRVQLAVEAAFEALID
eukprot:2874014-Amphidinium_carterae.1